MSAPNYKKKYLDEVRPHLMKKFDFTSIMQVPKVEKITLNIGLGDAKNNKKALQSALDELMLITGQKPVITKAKKDVSNFKVRKGFPVGCKVTLRKSHMYTFLDRLINVAIPRERDFRGLSPKSFDGRGNYAMGLKEHIVFPEIEFDKVDEVWGMDVIICTTANTDAEAKSLLKHFNMPFNS